ncbi:MAG: hypothetical protein ACERKZ_05775 [Lachnotalea sp.]
MIQMEKITTEMMEYVCDNICKHPGNGENTGITQEDLEEICAECKMGKFVCDIMNNRRKPGYINKEFDELFN